MVLVWPDGAVDALSAAAGRVVLEILALGAAVDGEVVGASVRFGGAARFVAVGSAGPAEGLGSGDQPLDADGAIKQGLVPPEGRQPLAAFLDPAGLQGVVPLVVGEVTAGRHADQQRQEGQPPKTRPLVSVATCHCCLWHMTASLAPEGT